MRVGRRRQVVGRRGGVDPAKRRGQPGGHPGRDERRHRPSLSTVPVLRSPPSLGAQQSRRVGRSAPCSLLPSFPSRRSNQSWSVFTSKQRSSTAVDEQVGCTRKGGVSGAEARRRQRVRETGYLHAYTWVCFRHPYLVSSLISSFTPTFFFRPVSHRRATSSSSDDRVLSSSPYRSRPASARGAATRPTSTRAKARSRSGKVSTVSPCFEDKLSRLPQTLLFSPKLLLRGKERHV